MRLLLVRHGQTTSNVGHHLDTAAPGASLTDLGREQAAGLPRALEGEQIAAIYVSNLVRTQETAAPLVEALGLEPRIRPGCREIVAGDFEMRSDVESATAYLETVFAWREDPRRRIPGGECGEEVFARFDAVVQEAASEYGAGATVLIVSHGAVIRAWTAARADNVDVGYAAEHWLPNTGMVALEGDPRSGWAVTRWTETALGAPELTDLAHTGPAGEPDEEAPEVAEELARD